MMQQLPMVTEALAVNGPAAGKRLNLLMGEHLYKWERDGQPVTVYKVCRFGVDRAQFKRELVPIYRIAFIDPKPTDPEIEALIAENHFPHYFKWNPWKDKR